MTPIQLWRCIPGQNPADAKPGKVGRSDTPRILQCPDPASCKRMHMQLDVPPSLFPENCFPNSQSSARVASFRSCGDLSEKKPTLLKAQSLSREDSVDRIQRPGAQSVQTICRRSAGCSRPFELGRDQTVLFTPPGGNRATALCDVTLTGRDRSQAPIL